MRAALAAAAEEASTSGSLSIEGWRRCCDVFASLSSLWAHARDAEAEAEREAAELFRSRTKPPTAAETLEGDDDKTEEEAYRRAFGDHGAMFEDLQRAPDAVMELGDDEGEEGKPKLDGKPRAHPDSDHDDDDDERTDEEKASIAAAKIAGLLEGDLLEEVVAVHRRVLGGLRGPPPPPPPPTRADDPAAAAAAANNPSGWWAASGAPPTPARYGRVLTPEEAARAMTFVRSYDVGAKIARAAGLVDVPVAVDEVSSVGHLLRTALEHACVTRAPLPADGSPMIHRVAGKSVETKDITAVTAVTELAAGSEAEAHDPAADAAADALGADLNEGGCAGEMYLVVAPVAAVRRRLTALLEEWPEHPLLEQLAEICDRVLALPLLSPLKQALTGLELLLARAQTWEEGAASHVSLAEELTACAKLALRWRQRELRTWPRLLARAAERHAQRAHRTWFALHRLLRPPASKKKKAKEDANADEEDAAAELDARGLDEEEAEGLRQVTLALEEYVQGSTIGEFRARLDLLWQFHADMAVEHRSIRSTSRGNGAREAALSNVLYNTWRYYVQFLPAVARQVEAARAPCAQKLRDHAKLAKWEDRGYHAMKTQGEANQRSLHKFVRAFDVSLNALVLPVLQATNGKVGLPDLPSERGAAEVAAASAAAAQNAKEAKNAAIEAKNKAARDAREKHKASSAGLYKNETVEERARREVDEEEAEKEYQREAEAARKRAIAEAARRASTAAESAAERMREEARADARQSWLDLTSSVVVDASDAARAIELASAAFHPGSPASAMAAPLRLDQEALYQSRLPALAKRLGEVLGSSLAGAPPIDSSSIAGQHGADDVDELASTVAARATALRDDKTAKKAVKKKALTDLLRALPKFGIQSARKYVPDSERSPSAWFREAPLPRPACLESLGPIAAEAFDAADAYYYRSMARVQRLRTVRGAAHSDLSSREVDVACGSVEHLLHILRRQRRNVAAAARVERGFATLADAVVALKSLGGSEPPPPQERTKRWLLSQRSALDAICESVAAAKLVHKTVSAAESTPGLKPGGGAAAAAAATLAAVGEAASTARDRLDAFLVPAMESAEEYNEGAEDAEGADADAGDGSWSAPPLVAADVAKALAGNFDELRAASAKIEAAFNASIDAVQSAPAVIEGAAPLPGWEPLRALLLDAVRSADAFAEGRSLPSKSSSEEGLGARAVKAVVDAKLAAAAEVQSRVAEASARLSESVEAATSAALVWAQNVKAAADGPLSANKGEDDMDADDEDDEPPTMTHTEEALSGAMGTKRLERLQFHLAAVSGSLADVTDAAAAAAPADSRRRLYCRRRRMRRRAGRAARSHSRAHPRG